MNEIQEMSIFHWSMKATVYKDRLLVVVQIQVNTNSTLFGTKTMLLFYEVHFI